MRLTSAMRYPAEEMNVRYMFDEGHELLCGDYLFI